MLKFVSGDLWSELKRATKGAVQKKAAFAYVSSDKDIQFNAGDLLIVDASEQTIRLGQTSAGVLDRAFKRGANLYSCPGLHAKVLVVGNRAIVGSANVSQSSKNQLVEAALITNRPNVVSPARAFLEQLKEQSEKIDKNFIERILKIKVVRRFPPQGSNKTRIKIKSSPSRTWLVYTSHLDEEAYPEEREEADKGFELAEEKVAKASSTLTWLRWTQRSQFRQEAKEGDSILQIWWLPGGKKPACVYPNATILRRQDEKHCTRFYIEEPLGIEKRTMRWDKFVDLTERVGIPGGISPHSVRQVRGSHADALHSLWKKA